MKATLRNKLPEVKVLVIDKISIASSHFWTKTDVRLSDIFSTSIELPFVSLSSMVIGDYLQLSSEKGDSSFQDLLVEVGLISYYNYNYGICLNMLNCQKLLEKVIRHLLMC